jgi:hypothetical protein
MNKKFLKNSYILIAGRTSSFGCNFVSLVLKKIQFYSSGLAWDWTVHLFLLSKGEINKTKQGLGVLGFEISTAKNSWKNIRTKTVEIFIPLYNFSKYTLNLIKNLNYYEWAYVFFKLLKLNFQSMKFSYIQTIRNLVT